MKALVLNCTLKASPAVSNTELLARVVMDALVKHDVETELVRVVDHDVKPGQNWTYWNRGPGPGDDYKDSEEGKEWSHSTAEAAASAKNRQPSGVLGDFAAYMAGFSPSTPFQPTTSWKGRGSIVKMAGPWRTTSPSTL